MQTTYESLGVPPPLEAPVLPESTVSQELNLVDLLLIAVLHKRAIIKVTGVAVVAAIIVALLMPNYYKGEAVILTPLRRPSISDALMGNFTGVLSGLTAADGLGLNDPNAVYVTMLGSRTIADHIIQRFRLQSYYDKKLYADTLEAFADDSNINSGHDGTISIAYLHKDPKIAAAIANAYVEELAKLTQTVAVTEAEQRRAFYHQQFEHEKELLADSEVALKQSQEKSGMLDLDKQATAMVTAIATLQGQIMGQEILIRGLRLSSTARHPDLIRAEEQLTAMKSQLSDLERRSGNGNGDVLVGTAKIPSSGLEYVRNLRNVKYHEAVYEILGKQYEAAVMDLGMGGDVVQVVSPALASDRKSKPKRLLIVVLAAFAAFVLAYLWAFFSEMFRRFEQDPVEGRKVQYILETLRAPWDWMRRNLRIGRLRLHARD